MANATAIYRYTAELGADVKEMEAELQGENAGDERLSNRLFLSLQRLRSECDRRDTLEQEQRDVALKVVLTLITMEYSLDFRLRRQELKLELYQIDQDYKLELYQIEQEEEDASSEEGEEGEEDASEEEEEEEEEEVGAAQRKARRLAGHPRAAPREAWLAGGVRTHTHRLQPQRDVMQHALVPRSSRRCSQLVVHDPAPGGWVPAPLICVRRCWAGGERDRYIQVYGGVWRGREGDGGGAAGGERRQREAAAQPLVAVADAPVL